MADFIWNCAIVLTSMLCGCLILFASVSLRRLLHPGVFTKAEEFATEGVMLFLQGLMFSSIITWVTFFCFTFLMNHPEGVVFGPYRSALGEVDFTVLFDGELLATIVSVVGLSLSLVLAMHGMHCLVVGDPSLNSDTSTASSDEEGSRS